MFAVDGSYDDVNRLCSELTYDRPWAFVNVNMRAYYAEGSKTIALETAEQLGWRVPDRVVAPIASGSLYTKILQGFEQGRAAGLIAPGPAPVMHGAQGEGCAPVASAYAAGADEVVPVRPTGIAKSLAIGNPADGVYALGVARRTGGSIESRARRRRSSRACSCSPARPGSSPRRPAASRRRCCAGSPSGARSSAGETVVAFITGDGLKTVEAVAGAVETIAIPADPDAVDAALGAPVGR